MLSKPSPMRHAMIEASTLSRSMLVVLGLMACLHGAQSYIERNGTFHPCSTSAEQAARHITGSIKGGVDTIHQVEREPCHRISHDRMRYRTYDGTCNAGGNGGASFSPVKRFMPPAYQDTLSSPRDKTRLGRSMPSARVVSLAVHRPKVTKSDFTLLLMQVGQFLDHDCSEVPVATETNDSIACCGVNARDKYHDCYEISIPPHDHMFKDCMEFVRSEPLTQPDGSVPHPRTHLNAITAWLDCSHIYGSDKMKAKELRARNGTGALLATKVYKGKQRLPEGNGEDCINLKNTHFCAKAGDDRVNEQPGLTAIHTVFHLEHNRLVRKLVRAVLYRSGRPYSDAAIEHFLQEAPNHVQERIYQIIRKVMGGIWQQIVYDEYLPLILGPKMMARYKLWTGRRIRYDPNIVPSIAQEFLSCAFRFGHTLINDMMFIDKMRPLKDLFSTSEHNLEHYNSIVRGLVSQLSHSEKFDSHLAEAITDKLFENQEPKRKALDLASLNIQRGRDHGIPRYNELRQFFGLEKVRRWQEFGDVWQQMKSVYPEIDDVECFPGGTAENPVEGGVVGETYAHIIGQQFHDLKYGDKYYYETDDTFYGFTTRELNSMSRLYLSKILCENANLDYIQRNPFLHPNHEHNPEYRCSDYPDIDVWYLTNYVY